ncbi:MAG: cupin domain-containing protein [Synechococcaceae cyanobacterium]|nr:cupin domain-containing protein [Synechococcaceae cyanobacterium]
MPRPLIQAFCLLGLGLSAATALPVRALGEAHLSTSPEVRTEVLVRSDRSWNGSPLPAYPSGQPQLTLVRITIPAGITLPKHHHPVITAGVLLQGRLKVVMENGQSKLIKAGDGLIEVVNQIHHGESLGPDPAVIVVMFAGVQGVPTTVENQAHEPGL